MSSAYKGLMLVAVGVLIGFGVKSFPSTSTGSLHNNSHATLHDQAPAQAVSNPLPFGKIIALSSNFEMSTELHQLIRYMNSNQLSQLLNNTEGYKDNFQRLTVGTIIYSRFTEIDPLGAIKKVLTNINNIESQWIVTVFRHWAITNLDAAVEFAATMHGQPKETATFTILKLREDLSQSERLIIAQALNGKSLLAQLNRQKAKNKFTADPQAAWEKALKLSNPQERVQKLLDLGRQWSRQDPRAAISALTQLESPQASSVSQSLIRMWANRDPEAALEWATNLPIDAKSSRWLNAVLGGLAMSDPHRAINFADSFSETEKRAALKSISRSWVSKDVEAAAAWLTSLNDPDIYQSVISTVAVSYNAISFEKAFHWLQTLTPEQSANAASIVFAQQAGLNLDKAKALIEKTDNSVLWEHSTIGLMQTWGRSDPQGALTWLENQQHPNRAQPYQYLLSAWSMNDSKAASAALDQITDPESYDAAAIGLMYTLAYAGSPERADAVYKKMQQGPKKRLAAQLLTQAWGSSNPERAEEYSLQLVSCD